MWLSFMTISKETNGVIIAAILHYKTSYYMRSILRFTLLLIILSSASTCEHLNLPSKSIDRIVLYSNQGLDSTLVEASDIDAVVKELRHFHFELLKFRRETSAVVFFDDGETYNFSFGPVGSNGNICIKTKDGTYISKGRHKLISSYLQKLPPPRIESGHSSKGNDWMEEIKTLEGAMRILEKPYDIYKNGDTTSIEYTDQYFSTSYVFVNDTLDCIIEADFMP